MLRPASHAPPQLLSRLGRGAYDVLVAMDVPAHHMAGQLVGDGPGDDLLHAPSPLPQQNLPAPAARQRFMTAASTPDLVLSSRLPPTPPAHSSSAVAPGPPPPSHTARAAPGGEAAGSAALLHPSQQLGTRRAPPAYSATGAKAARVVLLCALSAMECLEWLWPVWGADIVLCLLLLAAFTACSILTMVLLAALAAGMAAG